VASIAAAIEPYRPAVGSTPDVRLDAGDKKAQIAREFGISRETLYQYLRTTP
jgi:hypothetical protein